MYDFYCRACARELHLSACFERQRDAERALDLLGWTRTRCPDCQPAEPKGQKTREE